MSRFEQATAVQVTSEIILRLVPSYVLAQIAGMQGNFGMTANFEWQVVIKVRTAQFQNVNHDFKAKTLLTRGAFLRSPSTLSSIVKLAGS